MSSAPPSSHQLNLLMKNVSKTKSARLSSNEIVELRDLKSSVDELTWSQWLAFARSEKHRKKDKKKGEKISRSYHAALAASESRSDEQSESMALSLALPTPAPAPAPAPSPAAAAASPAPRGRSFTDVLDNYTQVSVSHLNSSPHNESPKTQISPTSSPTPAPAPAPSPGLLTNPLALSPPAAAPYVGGRGSSTSMKQKKELQSRISQLESSLLDSQQQQLIAEQQLRSVVSNSNNNNSAVLNELANAKSQLSALAEEYEIAQEMTDLFSPKQAAEAAFELQAAEKNATWRSAAVRAAYLRVRHASDAASAAAAAAFALQSFLAGADPRIAAAPGMQDVVSAMSAAADAQRTFVKVAADCGGALAPLIDPTAPPAPAEPSQDEEDERAFWDDFKEGGGREEEETSSEEESKAGSSVVSASAKKKKGVVKSPARKAKANPNNFPKGLPKTKIKTKQGSLTAGTKKMLEVAPDPHVVKQCHKLRRTLKHLRSDNEDLKLASRACMASVTQDLTNLSDTFAAAMVQILDSDEANPGGGALSLSRIETERSFVGLGSPPRPPPGTFNRQLARRKRNDVDGGVRITAHIQLAPPEYAIGRQTAAAGVSNVKIKGNRVELGILGAAEVDVLRVDFGRVFAYRGEEHLYNQNVLAEVRPCIANAVTGDGPPVVTVLSVGAGSGNANSAAFLEGREGDTGLMWECVRTVFQEIDREGVHGHDDNVLQEEAFYRNLQVCVTAVEVVGGEVRDLLRGGVSGDLQTIDTEEPLCQEFDRDQATPTVEDKMLKVKVNSEHDFNKLLGVITSVRSSHRALDIQRGHKLGRNSGHVVVRMGVVSEGRRWCDVVFVGLNVPQVEDCVLTGDLLEDDGGMGGGGGLGAGGGGVGGRLERRDMLHAQEDCSAVAGILEMRLGNGLDEQWGEEKRGGGGRRRAVDAGEWDSALARVAGKYLEGTSCIRTFVHMEVRKCDAEETKDNASGMLWASLCQGCGF